MGKSNDLITRKRVGIVVDKELWEKFGDLSKSTRIPKSRLIDEAIEDLLKKHDCVKSDRGVERKV